MKSSSGHYFQAQDHVRALAAFTVFVWHFMSYNDGHLTGPLVFPLSYFTEGHTGVALFMTLSGYLFAKLLDGRKISYPLFLWNRFVRLAPLMAVVMLIVGVLGWYGGTLEPATYAKELLRGFVYPTWPNGGWSIAVELHFYLILPLLLYAAGRQWWVLPSLLLLPLAWRCGYYYLHGEVQSLAYWTIFGRLDQFILGILLFRHRNLMQGRGWLAATVLLAFLVFWYFFDAAGGFFKNPSYPSPSPVWLVLTFVEGLTYASLIAWYDTKFSYSDSRTARFIALIGSYSYSLYLLHFFFVFKMPVLINQYLVDLSNRYVLLLFAVPCFLALLPLSWLSYRFIEEPCLKFRRAYIR